MKACGRLIRALLCGLGFLLILAGPGRAQTLPPEMRGRLSSPWLVDPSKALQPLGPPEAGIPLAPWLGDVKTNQDLGVAPQNETSVAANLLNPLNLVGGANDYRLGDASCGVYSSLDAGQTWTDGVIPRLGFDAGADPAVAFDRNGAVYYACLLFNRTNDINRITVSKSLDGGRTFAPPVTVVAGTSSSFNDKEYLAVDVTGSPFAGSVYVSWTRFTGFTARILLARSIDGGATWFGPSVVSDVLLGQGSVPAVGPNGELHVTWFDFSGGCTWPAPSPSACRIMLDTSTDGGVTFGGDRLVNAMTAIPSPLPGFGWQFRTNSFPTVGVDTSAGPRRGTVYVAWADSRNGDADILLSRSVDGGATWSVPVRVNDDSLANGRHQFFPWLSVDPNGSIHVVWYDNRLGSGSFLDLFYATSGDGGVTFSAAERVSDVSFNPNVQFGGEFIGDYNGVTSTAATVHPLWTDSRQGQQDIFTDRSPATFSTPAGALGINAPTFKAGETLVGGTILENPGAPMTLDLYVGALLPVPAAFAQPIPESGVLVFLTPGGLVLGNLADPTTFVPLQAGMALFQNFEQIIPALVSYTFTGSEPLGSYVGFLVLALPGAFADGRIDPGDIVVLDLKGFQVIP